MPHLYLAQLKISSLEQRTITVYANHKKAAIDQSESSTLERRVIRMFFKKQQDSLLNKCFIYNEEDFLSYAI